MAPIKPTTGKKATSNRLPKPSGSPTEFTKRAGEKNHGLLGISSKKDKRTIKHSALISRIEKSKATFKKRRRPSKKLITNLESLAAALPDAPESKKEMVVIGDGKIRHKSLKSRPGAMKRKEKLASSEKDRFNKNMAQMMAPTTTSQDDPFTTGTGRDEAEGGSPNKWAALRGFIQQTMEQRNGD